ncbi:MAG: hypothetical protein J4469_04385 [Candidatus Aenigmarchaeota archaeon]|nr:hypothetical protein [Candidatus Aenigmarchaeota archaeon]
MKRKAPFGIFIRENEENEVPGHKANKANIKNKRARRLSDRQILKELSRVLGVSENDLPKTLERFKKDVDEMVKGTGEG